MSLRAKLIQSSYRYPVGSTNTSDRAALIRNALLPLLGEIDARPYDVNDDNSWQTLREQCFAWADTFMVELRIEQAAHERGACLEGLAAVLERWADYELLDSES
jgi:hypothetical protein